MNLNKSLRKIEVRCINLKSRKDKRKYVKTHLRRKNINFKFFKTTKHNNPKRVI